MTLNRTAVLRKGVRGGLVFGGFLIVTLLSGGCGPVWYLDPGFAERLAAQKKKPLLLYFKSWDSTVHRNMRLQVLDNGAVKSELTGTINVELEFAYFPEYRRRYGVRQSQVCVMCDPDGKRVASPLYVNPVPTPEVFLDWLKQAKAEALPATASGPSR